MIALALALAGCTGEAAGPGLEARRRHNIVLLVIDTLDDFVREGGALRVRSPSGRPPTTGCVTNVRVLCTAAGAAMRGYDVEEVVEAAAAGLDPGDHAFALRQMERVLGARRVGREDA